MVEKAGERSLKAKRYINGKVNSMRDAFRKAPDEEAKKQLVETFRKTISSDEYQENLKVVNEDAKKIRKPLKPRERMEKFEGAREDFYGKLNLYLSEEDIKEWEKLDKFEKIDFLFKKLGDGDRTLSIFLDLAVHHEGTTSGTNWRGEKTFYWDGDYESWIYHMGKNKFHNISMKMADRLLSTYPFIALILNDPNAFSDEVRQDPRIFQYIKRCILQNPVSSWVYTDENLSIIFDKIGDDKVEEIVQLVDIDNFMKIVNVFKDRKDVNDIIDKLAKKGNRTAIANSKYVNRTQLIQKYEEFVSKIMYSWAFNEEEGLKPYQKKFADAFIEAGYADIIRRGIENGCFTGLTDEEKSEILGRDLAKEKFDADLAKLQELGAKLGKEIVVKDLKEEVHISEPIQEPVEEEVREVKKRRWPFGRRK